MMIISIRFKEALNENNLTCAELARICGISKGTISNYYNGKHIPCSDCAYKIADVLHVSPAWLMGLDVPKYNNSVATDKTDRLLALFNKLDYDAQENAIEVMRSLCKISGVI